MGNYTPILRQQGSAGGTVQNRFKRRLGTEPLVFSEAQMNTTVTPGLTGLAESTQDDSSVPAGTNLGSENGVTAQDFTRKRELMQRNIDNILRGNMYGTMSQKVVMDRNYYNMFYKYQDSNAKLLKIRQQTRLNQES